MKKIIIGLVALSSVSVFAETRCPDLIKKTVSLLSSGTVPVSGRYGIEVQTLQKNATLKRVDAIGNEESVNVDILRATAFYGSFGMSYKAWVADKLESNTGCTILKISREGVR